jgi:hypothetical protein
MAATISASAKKCYRRIGQFHVKWDKFRIKCREGFQLVYPSDFGFSLRAITLNVKHFSTDSCTLQSHKNIFVSLRRSVLSTYEIF